MDNIFQQKFKSVIYVLANPSLLKYLKIGYANNIITK